MSFLFLSHSPFFYLGYPQHLNKLLTLSCLSQYLSSRVWTKQMTQSASRIDSPDKTVRMSLVVKILADMRSSSRVCSRNFHYTWGSPAWGSQNFACIDHKVFIDDGIVGILLLGICQDYLWERHYVSALEMLGSVNSIRIKIPKYSVVTFSLKSKIQKQRCKFLSLTGSSHSWWFIRDKG